MLFAAQALAQDYEREKRWSDSITKTLMIGSAEWLQQKNGHRFLALYTEAEKPRGAAIIAHGRGWSPDFELYGTLRTRLAETASEQRAHGYPPFRGLPELREALADRYRTLYGVELTVPGLAPGEYAECYAAELPITPLMDGAGASLPERLAVRTAGSYAAMYNQLAVWHLHRGQACLRAGALIDTLY